MLILGIETSCDETALALVADGRKILATQVASSIKSHQRYGGIVPEIASRAHVELITCELEALFSAARISPSAVDRIAVTHGPGLPGALVIGVAAAKALALAWKKPMVGVNHLQAHLYAAWMSVDWPLNLPMAGLVISGGHTALVCAKGMWTFQVAGQTLDDAVGEAFDKVAKMLGLGFPGGPEIERVAQNGNPQAFRFAVPKIKAGSAYDFSLSGIKTAVLYKIRGRFPQPGAALPPEFVADMAASFQSAVVEEVVMKTVGVCRDSRLRHLMVGGGVVANQLLRNRLQEACRDQGVELAIPPFGLCTDNGAMVAGLAHHLDPVSASHLAAVPDLFMGLN